MKATLAQSFILSLQLLCHALPFRELSTESRSIRLPLRKATNGPKIRSRQIPATLKNNDYNYLIDLEVGTPAQSITLTIDTGSSDVVIFEEGSCSTCEGGSYDPSESSSLVNENTPFSTSYFDGTAFSGNYIADTVSVGDATATGVILALASSVSSKNSALHGIMGIGLDGLEASPTKYNGFIDDLYNEGIISSKSYTIFLDDVGDSAGSIIFGGGDSSKYSGDLVALPIQPYTDNVPRLQVEWTGLSLTDSTGKTTALTSSDLSYPVALDTGYTTIVVPTELFNELYSYFGVSTSTAGDYLVPCDVPDGYLSFGFGAGPAVTINVPFYELAVPTTEAGTCLFGLLPQEGNVISFGDPFLRSAYVTYDYDAMTISLAQANWA
ncbi:hypothetical protein H2200_010982 [Cladophialophora chaetospira]|uniref:Peptidase A1 domain-containing protein n=1 Tax=Cladophialophora chaetospira TaxID=386627 RepID=A0AA39CE51_9EURO|nr:hypothetical protein H2200_010982 [Cladophialophora chaetospira]